MKNNADRTVYEAVEERVDNKTGEVINTINRKVIKKAKTPEFIMLFVNGVDKLTNSNLSQAQHKVLSQLLKYTVRNSNMLMLNSAVREMIANDSNLKLSTVNMSITVLIKKELIIRNQRLYYLNPSIFGKGDFNEIKRLRHTFSIDYDFEKLEAVSSMKIDTLYEKVDKNKVEILEKKEIINDKHKEQTVIIQEKNNNNKDIEFLKEQNKAKELSIKELELKIKAKEMGL